MFQRYFLDIIEIILKLKNQRVIMIFFMKLNILNIIQEEILKVLKNEVLSTEIQMETFFCICKRIVRALEDSLREESFPYKAQIISLNCWKSLKKRYGKSAKNCKLGEIEASFINLTTKKNSFINLSPSTEIKSKKSVIGFARESFEKNSETKMKASFSLHSGLGLKSSATVFLTSPKMKTMNSPKIVLSNIK